MANTWDATTTAEEVASSLSSQITNKVILTTGVSPGSLGANFVLTIAAHSPSLLILAGRNTSKSAETASAIKAAHPSVQTRILELDLNSQAQIRKAAAEVLGYEENIDVLMNNAGIMAQPYGKTVERIESQFGCNFIGHWLFTNLVMDKINRGGRIVNVSSDGNRFSEVRFEDWNFQDGKTYNKWKAYGQAKTANILFSVALADKLKSKGISAYSLHPGVIMTNLGLHLIPEDFDSLKALDKELGNKEAEQTEFVFKTMSQGTATHVVAAFDPKIADHNGAYLVDAGLAPDDELKPYAYDRGIAERLWKLAEEIVGQKFEY